MPEWDEGLLDFDYDPSTGDISSTMDPASIGSAYYNLNADNPYGASMFWFDLLQEFLPMPSEDAWWMNSGNPDTVLIGGSSTIPEQGIEISNTNFGLGQYEGFMQMYGEYLPQDFGLGQSRIARGKRLNRAGVGVLHGDSMSEAANLRTKYGKSGFASSGMQSKTGQDIWKKYIGSAKGRQENMREMEHGVHAEFGQSVLDTLQGMAADSASGQFFVGPGSASYGGWNTDWFGDTLSYDTAESGFFNPDLSVNTEYAQWVGGIHEYCNNPDNIGQEYYQMCAQWMPTSSEEADPTPGGETPGGDDGGFGLGDDWECINQGLTMNPYTGECE